MKIRAEKNGRRIYFVSDRSKRGIRNPIERFGQSDQTEIRGFKVRDYGYSQFKQYIQSFPEVELQGEGERTKAVYAPVL